MAAIRHLDKAPITEALIDLRVALPGNSIDKLKQLVDRVSDRFPKNNPVHQGEFMLKMAKTLEETEQQFKQAVLGYICSSEDETRKVQFRLDGFTFNKLHPYETWERMRDEAKELWAMYVDHMAPGLPVQRIGLRYINHLDIPFKTPFEEYLTAPATVPKGLPQSISEYLYRVVLRDEGAGAFAIVTQQTQPAQKGASGFRMLLDIDVSRDNANLTGDQIWPVFETFHDFKNLIFFESITEKTAEMYEK